MAGGHGSALGLVVTLGGPTMFARIGVMRAQNRHVERVSVIGVSGSWREIDKHKLSDIARERDTDGNRDRPNKY
jgi:hypothetical protein